MDAKLPHAKMFEEGFHLPFLKDLLQGVYLQVFSAHSEVSGCRVELQAMNRLLQLKCIDHFIGSVVDYVQPAFFSSRKDVVSLASHCVDV